MSKDFLIFIKRLTIFSLVVMILSWASTFLIPGKYLSHSQFYLIFFFYIVTLFVYYFISKASEQKFAKFVTTFMLTTFLKLMLYLAVLLIYIFLISRQNAVPFISAFFIYYLLFTVFETVYVLIVSKGNKYKDS